MAEDLSFKTTARLIRHLGDRLIRNEGIALLELVKNSYDADATYVKIEMTNIEDKDKGAIIIEDNGSGMDAGILENIWLEPGSDYKEKLVHGGLFKSKFGRLPLGEKGIGRFAIQKLGDEMIMETRSENQKEICLKINWSIFETDVYLNDIKVKVLEKENDEIKAYAIIKENAEIFRGINTGTRITVKKLKTAWNMEMTREIYRAINSMCSPFQTIDSFRIDFNVDKKEWLKGILPWEEIKKSALFNINYEIVGNEIKSFKYEFIPWPSMEKLNARIITEKDKEISSVKEMEDKNRNAIDLSKYKIGKIKFEAYIFDREPKILSLGIKDKKNLKDYLNANGGIRIYRDGIRVYDYGEKGNDWLGLDIGRVNIPGKRISNNIIIGAIHLDSQESSDLIEKTNREGFIDNSAYKEFKNAILYVFNILENFRYEDKKLIRKYYGSTPGAEPVIENIINLRNFIDKKVKDEGLKRELKVYIDRIEKDYKFVNENLLINAGSGLNLRIIVHEIEKILAELKKVVDLEKPSERITETVKHLAHLIESYSVLFRHTEKKTENLKKIIDQAVFNSEFRFKAHNIEIINAYSYFSANINVKCMRNITLGTIMNIFDNSIWWLDYAKIKNKKIYIDIIDMFDEYVCILIADNGKGFSLSAVSMTEPFVSAKPGGMGLGLYIAKEVMQANGGRLIFPDINDGFDLPEEFKNGAIVALAFIKEEKQI